MSYQLRIPRFFPIKMVDIELSEPLEDITGLEEYATVRGLVRLHGTPLGYIDIGVFNGVCKASMISKTIIERFSLLILDHLISDRLATPLEASKLYMAELVHAPHPTFPGPFPQVTVAVCTRNRIADLATCLAALDQLTYKNLDLLVIDNAPSNQETETLVRTQYPHIRYVCEPRPGLSWARNRAIIEAHGEIIAFTDDDVIVDSGWIDALAQTFAEHPDVIAVTGLVVPYELETEAQILFEVQGGFGRGFTRKWYKFDSKEARGSTDYHGAGKFGTGANMAFRHRLFDYIGHFDPALGVGTVTNGGEDLEIFFRLLHAGYTLVYEPNALVRHRHRRDYMNLRSQLTNNAIGLTSFHVRSALAYPDQRVKFVRLHLWWLLHWHLKRLLQAMTRPHRVPLDLIRSELRGYLGSPLRYRAAKRQVVEIAKRYGPLTPNITAHMPDSIPTYFARMPAGERK